jgi:hypothetical protein
MVQMSYELTIFAARSITNLMMVHLTWPLMFAECMVQTVTGQQQNDEDKALYNDFSLT